MNENIENLCGIDEAGRGCIAGPMVVAGVILCQDFAYKDSKALSAKRRLELYEEIIKNPHKICIVTNKEIDSFGISECLKKCLQTIMSSLSTKRYLFDGNCNYGIGGLETMVKADKHNRCVAAASILAKVTKDKILCEEGKSYKFDFCSHQGYATRAHIAEIKQYGYSNLHRKSFKIKELL